MGRAAFRAALTGLLLVLSATTAAAQSPFRFDGPQFVLDGKPFQILAGELHFQRIPKEYWKDRLLKARAMGLNTVCTYVFWNILEPEPGQWNFNGNKVFCSELYPGWLTHWGEAWASVKTEEVLADLRWLLENGKSFNFYVFHGGTNFGFFAGANYGNEYQPDVTSYDYDAPLNEMGQPTPKYFAIRDALAAGRPGGAALPEIPGPLPVIEIPEFTPSRSTSIFDNLPRPIPSPQPRPMEAFSQNFGFILYRTRLIGHHSGKLTITDVHDFANIYADGRYLGSLNRAKKGATIEIPKADPPVQRLDILVEGMGRINFGQQMIDRKGITDRVTLNGMTLMDWEVFPLPMETRNIAALKFADAAGEIPGTYFQGTFDLASTGDTYLDMSRWKKGVVWVNGHNLGRYWEIGPQQRLYCPAPFLKVGRNDVVVFDLLSPSPAPLRGVKSLKGD